MSKKSKMNVYVPAPGGNGSHTKAGFADNQNSNTNKEEIKQNQIFLKNLIGISEPKEDRILSNQQLVYQKYMLQENSQTCIDEHCWMTKIKMR